MSVPAVMNQMVTRDMDSRYRLNFVRLGEHIHIWFIIVKVSRSSSKGLIGILQNKLQNKNINIKAQYVNCDH